ncbi:uncharacterized protein LOC127094384 [Lathyrus oleraceus]|uniref:uncharacterized protein LOC127094384 n=1 Tax=Pisum sativum TaxID=3888 RepID=UPI0021D34387|nr:uncharacterized protein LOC127094384 [Pisum sativum]
MDHLLETMLSMAMKESNAEINVDAHNIVDQIGSSPLNIPGATNPEFGFPLWYVHTEGVHVPPHVVIPVVNLGAQETSSTSARHGSLYKDNNGFYMPLQMRPTVGTFPDLVVERLYELEKKFKSMEVHFTPDLDVVDMCLVLGLVIPQKFKVLDFDKYKGVSCLCIHLRAYYRKMASHIDNEKLLIHYFQDNLNKASLEWYMQLERSQVQSWRDLIEAFLRQYQYNINLVPNRAQLQDMTHHNNESFKEYAQ